jgi:undecaprenyl-diphosphatase
MKRNQLLSLIFLILFILIALNINSQQITYIDNSVNLFFSLHQVNLLHNLSAILGILFEPIYVIIYLIILSAILYFLNKKKHANLLISASVIGGFSIYVLKHIFSRARPLNVLVEETSFSFPSGHALFSIILFGILIYFCASIKSKNKIIIYKTSCIFAILLIGLSRLYLNAHWFSDIIAGYCFGLFLLLGILSINLISFKNNQPIIRPNK